MVASGLGATGLLGGMITFFGSGSALRLNGFVTFGWGKILFFGSGLGSGFGAGTLSTFSGLGATGSGFVLVEVPVF